MVKEDKLQNPKRLELAINYLMTHANEDTLNVAELEKACGVGVVISDEAI